MSLQKPLTSFPMPRDNQHSPDPNVNAARIVAEATRRSRYFLGGFGAGA
jgi:hypothetical protein